MDLGNYVLGETLGDIAAAAARFEALGSSCLWTVEAQHDPFLPLVAAAPTTSRMRLGTNIAVALARNPMTVAHTAHDLQQFSSGRFVLGLGSQVKAHIERRFAMPWSRPAARMREFVLALRAIWSSWATGEPLSFTGEFYRHTLSSPNFTPAALRFGPPPIYLAAVGPQMTAVATEVADGLLCHPLTTPEYLASVIGPARDRVTAEHQSARGFGVVVSVLAATGPDDAAQAASVENVRRKIAFYGATPAYRPVLDLHGLGDLQPRLNQLARDGRWDDMAGLISDDVLEVFAVVGAPREIGRRVRQRFEGHADQATIYELDADGRLALDTRYLAEPGPMRELLMGFGAVVTPER